MWAVLIMMSVVQIKGITAYSFCILQLLEQWPRSAFYPGVSDLSEADWCTCISDHVVYQTLSVWST